MRLSFSPIPFIITDSTLNPQNIVTKELNLITRYFWDVGLTNGFSCRCDSRCLSPRLLPSAVSCSLLWNKLSGNQIHICCCGTMAGPEEAQVLSAGGFLHLTPLTLSCVSVMTWQAHQMWMWQLWRYEVGKGRSDSLIRSKCAPNSHRISPDRTLLWGMVRAHHFHD